jgi:RNA polymerase-binding transcription factor DksA
MSDQDLQSALERGIERLQDEMARIVGLTNLKSDWSGDQADKASGWIEQTETWAKHRFLDQRCQQYIHAKARCDAGLAGVCEICGRAIDPARLRVMVDATTCVSCKKRARQRAVGRTQLGFAYGL